MFVLGECNTILLFTQSFSRSFLPTVNFPPTVMVYGNAPVISPDIKF